jgi:hypothetical protein
MSLQQLLSKKTYPKPTDGLHGGVFTYLEEALRKTKEGINPGENYHKYTPSTITFPDDSQTCLIIHMGPAVA